MEIENLWNEYFEASKLKFSQNSDLKNFQTFLEDSYSVEEIKKFLPRMTEIIPSFDLIKSGKTIEEFLDFSINEIYNILKDEPKKIFDFLKDNLYVKDKNHIFDTKETEELLINLHGELSILFVSLKELHKYFKISIKKIQNKLDLTKILSIKELFTLMDVNLCILAYDTFIDWIFCNKKYLNKIIPLLVEQQMNFCIATIPYNFFDKAIYNLIELDNYIVKNFPEFI